MPVLFHPETKKDLGWPFDQTQVKKFILIALQNSAP
ncbi:MAG: hypothetical protein LUQ48_06415 [Methylococcaceae bacterium]|nr:hypothetical protein [Methylococcaceae bacterium]